MRSALWISIAAAGCAGDIDANPGGDGDRVVRVEVTDGGVPVAARVVFHDPSGGVAALVDTGPSGVAEHPIEPGGLVTVAYPDEIALITARVQLVTHAGVDPGDELSIEIPEISPPPPSDPGPVAGVIELELPPLEGAGHFVAHLGCADVVIEAPVARIEVPEPCLGTDDRVDVSVDAFTPPDLPSRLATTVARHIEVTGDGVTRVTLPDWIAPDPTIEVALVDLPAGATDAVAIPIMLADGLAFGPRLPDRVDLSAGDPVLLSPGFFPSFAEQMDLEVRVTSGTASVTAAHLLSAPVSARTELSGASLLPAIGELAVDGEASTLTWAASGSAAGADATVVFLRSERREGAVRRTRRWTVIAPPETASPLALPALPAELEDYRPRPDDEYLEPGIVTFDVDWVDGYDAFVADHGAGFFDDACVPASSTARLAYTGVFYGPRLATPDRWR